MREIYRVGRGCVLCGTCISVCPAGSIDMDQRGARIDPEKCHSCGACLKECPEQVIVREVVPENGKEKRRDDKA